MNKKGHNRKKENMLNLIVIFIVMGMMYVLKNPVINILSSIKSEISDKIIFISMFLEKPKNTANYYIENYVRHDEEINNNSEKLEISSESETIEEAKEILSDESEKPLDNHSEEFTNTISKKPPNIDPKYRGNITTQFFGGADNQCCVKKDGVYIRNYTNLTADKIL